MIVLDGQQRLTAMHYAFFGPSANFPSRKNNLVFRIDVRLLLEEDFDNFIDYEFALVSLYLAENGLGAEK